VSAPARATRLRSVTLPGGLRLECAEQGPPGGEPVLCLHGITDSWRSFEPVLPWLPGEWHTIAFSQRGHGGSARPEGGYRTRDFAADAAALIEALELPPVVLVGHSMGAVNALRLAVDRPDLVRGIVAAGAFASFGDKPELVAFIRDTMLTLADSVPRELADAFQRDTVAGPVAAGLIDTMVDECCVHRRRSGGRPLPVCSKTTSAPSWAACACRCCCPGATPTPSRRTPTSSGCCATCRRLHVACTAARVTRCTGSSPNASRSTSCASSVACRPPR
jgi:pimeloyl-ACP methyl ester carboxylesterase